MRLIVVTVLIDNVNHYDYNLSRKIVIIIATTPTRIRIDSEILNAMFMIIEEKNIYTYGEKEKSAPLIIVNEFEGDGSSLYETIKEHTDRDFCLAYISDIDWNDEMSPWECAPIFKNEPPFSGGADRYLERLTGQILPAIKEYLKEEPEYIVLAGYSLAGLFSLYSLYQTDVFSRVVSASGSLWYPDFEDHVRNHEFVKRPDKVYFSLGDREALTKNPMMSTVEQKTRSIYEMYKDKGIDTVFEMNPGNHFKDAEKRLAKGIAWVIED